MAKKQNTAQRIAKIVDRTEEFGSAKTTVDGDKIECFLGAPSNDGQKQRLCFRLNGARVSRASLFSHLFDTLG